MANRITNLRARLESAPFTDHRKQFVLLALAIALTTCVPYLFATPVSVSLSYVVHFNNKVCVIVLLICAWLYAVLTKGDNGPVDSPDNDRPLSVFSLVVALCYVAAILWAHVYEAITGVGVGEAMYSVNRLQMMVDGKRLYTGFEYAYGPLHLVVPLLLHRWVGISAYAAYYAWWAAQYLLGIAAAWALVRMLEFPMRYRTFVFWGLVFLLVPSLSAEGIAYTPVRMIGSAFLLVAVHACSKRWQLPRLTATVSLLSIALALSVSADQGISVAAGLLAWLWLRTLSPVETASRAVASSVTVGAILLFAWAALDSYFVTARQFATGAYNFPITPSLHVSLVVITCVFAVVAGYLAMKQGRYDAQAIPLLFGGMALLPAAFGRADLGHMLLAAPLLMLGIGYIQSHVKLRRAWNLSYLLLFLLPSVWPMLHQQFRHVSATAHAFRIARATADKSRNIESSSLPGDSAAISSTSRAQEPSLSVSGKCPVTYRVITLGPSPRHTATQDCMDTGYYFGLTNAFTPEALDRKIAELDRKPRVPLLLMDLPLEKQFQTLEDDPHVLYILQMALMTPPVRRQAMTYQKLIDYIRTNYIPDEQARFSYRVWRPRTSK